ncbi:MAG: 3-oxoacyl-[acyl-carrier-protein] reductase [Chloroflexota bacterium]|nr:3-oxoacyl-[acyl-carrier-protein] reductase [Chloroflexota bacterium]
MSLSGRVALVTGSGRGIGRAIALRLAQEGATLVVNDLEVAGGGRAVAEEIQAAGGQALAIAADISHPSSVQELMETAATSLGGIDIIVNNAGITRDALIMRMSEEDWDRVLTINLKGAFLCTKAALRHMVRRRWGRIINIASVVGLLGNAGQANYASAKAGLIALTKATAREVASRGITANAIAPGFIDTDMTRNLSPELKEEILRQIPLGIFGQPEDVAHAAAFLASEAARYITGHVLHVNGGMAMV